MKRFVNIIKKNIFVLKLFHKIWLLIKNEKKRIS